MSGLQFFLSKFEKGTGRKNACPFRNWRYNFLKPCLSSRWPKAVVTWFENLCASGVIQTNKFLLSWQSFSAV